MSFGSYLDATAIALSEPGWTVVGILVTTTIAPIAVAVVGRILNSKISTVQTEVTTIGKAVNHVPEGEPTLVKRVSSIEQENKNYRAYEMQVFQLLAEQLGVELPKYEPHKEEEEVKP